LAYFIWLLWESKGRDKTRVNFCGLDALYIYKHNYMLIAVSIQNLRESYDSILLIEFMP